MLATHALCHSINPEAQVETIIDRFKRSFVQEFDASRDLAVFVCVDSIAARRLIWETLSQRAAFLADGRMSAEVIRVVASADPAGDQHYPTTLFADVEAYSGSCTAKSTIYTASIAAGLMLTQFTRWLRRLPVDSDVTLNLLSMELGLPAVVAA